MNRNDNHFLILAAQAGRGDPQAAAQLQRDLGRHLPRVVRRALSAGRSPLARGIRAVAAAVTGPPSGPADGPEELADRLAQVIGRSLVQWMRQRPGERAALEDTVRDGAIPSTRGNL